jgi:hypothetical protein
MLLTGAPSAFAMGGCPNEGLRGENRSLALPDCRAYELVTPPFKAGELPFSFAFNDSRMLYSSLGGFDEPGDNTTSAGSAYLAGRGTGGWSTGPIELSSTEFLNQYNTAESNPIRDVSRDLGGVVFARAPSSSNVIDQRLYISHPGQAGGGLTQIGPMVPPAAVAVWGRGTAENRESPEVEYAAGSPDLSHVLFTSFRFTISKPGANYFLWPGNTTVAHASLYEYVGGGHSGAGSDVPALVGVSDGRTVVDGNTIPAGQVISQCGSVLGGANLEDRSFETYNAISERSTVAEEDEGIPVASEEGARVLFTAPKAGCVGRNAAGEEVTGEGPFVDQLFARVNGTHTVSISEPTKAACSECDTAEAEEPTLPGNVEAANLLQADFQGASSDGSRVYFLSRQQLLPGSVKEATNLYEYDFRATPGKQVKLIATNMAEREEGGVPNAGVLRIAADGSRVYFVSTAPPLASNLDTSGASALPGADNLYVYDTASGRYTFIAALSASDSADWKPRDAQRQAAATPDGGFLLFASTNHLTPDAAGSFVQLYRYDARAGEANAIAEEEGHPATGTPLARVTIGEEGYNNNGNMAALEAPQLVAPLYATYDLAYPQGLSITNDGSKVFFTDSLGLTPLALNNRCLETLPEESEGHCYPGVHFNLGVARNVYEYESGHVYLISDGADRHIGQDGSSTIGLEGTTPSGSTVIFGTADQLIPADTDTGRDFYSATVDGGFPTPTAPSECQGESCQGPLPPAPVSATPASTNIFGQGNLGAPALAPPPPPVKPPATLAQRLASALKACHAIRSRAKRVKCETLAHRKYKPTAHKATRHTHR